MEKNDVLDIIIDLVHGVQSEDNAVKGSWKDRELAIGSARYIKKSGLARELLNKTLRFYRIPDENLFVSKKAFEVWKEITDISIWDYHDLQAIKLDNCEKIVLKTKKFEQIELIRGEKKTTPSIQFNQVFHTEHLTDINSVIDSLCALKGAELNYANVMKILDKICMARILKEEAANLDHNNKTGRGLDLKHVIRILSNHDIELLHEDGTALN